MILPNQTTNDSQWQIIDSHWQIIDSHWQTIDSHWQTIGSHCHYITPRRYMTHFRYITQTFSFVETIIAYNYLNCGQITFTVIQYFSCVFEGTTQLWEPTTAATITPTQSTQFVTYNYPSLTLTQLSMMSVCTLAASFYGRYH